MVTTFSLLTSVSVVVNFLRHRLLLCIIGDHQVSWAVRVQEEKCSEESLDVSPSFLAKHHASKNIFAFPPTLFDEDSDEGAEWVRLYRDYLIAVLPLPDSDDDAQLRQELKKRFSAGSFLNAIGARHIPVLQSADGLPGMFAVSSTDGTNRLWMLKKWKTIEDHNGFELAVQIALNTVGAHSIVPFWGVVNVSGAHYLVSDFIDLSSVGCFVGDSTEDEEPVSSTRLAQTLLLDSKNQVLLERPIFMAAAKMIFLAGIIDVDRWYFPAARRGSGATGPKNQFLNVVKLRFINQHLSEKKELSNISPSPDGLDIDAEEVFSLQREQNMALKMCITQQPLLYQYDFDAAQAIPLPTPEQPDPDSVEIFTRDLQHRGPLSGAIAKVLLYSGIFWAERLVSEDQSIMLEDTDSLGLSWKSSFETIVEVLKDLEHSTDVLEALRDMLRVKILPWFQSMAQESDLPSGRNRQGFHDLFDRIDKHF